jgi:hypothetical protein
MRRTLARYLGRSTDSDRSRSRAQDQRDDTLLREALRQFALLR